MLKSLTSKKLLYTACFIAILVLSPSAFPSNQTPEFKVAISTVDRPSKSDASDKIYYSLGEKVWIKIDITNLSNEAMNVPIGLGFIRPILSRNSEKVPYRKEISEQFARGEGGIVSGLKSLQPGQPFTEIIDLEDFYEPLKEGEYKIAVEHRFFKVPNVLSDSNPFEVISPSEAKIKIDLDRARKLADNSDVVLVAKILEVEHSPGYWSGSVPSLQKVRYRIETLYKGEADESKITVAHYIVRNSRSADRNSPELSRKIFASGEELLLFLKADKSQNGDPGSFDSTYHSICENYGAIPIDGRIKKLIKKVIISQDKTKVARKSF